MHNELKEAEEKGRCWGIQIMHLYALRELKGKGTSWEMEVEASRLGSCGRFQGRGLEPAVPDEVQV